MGWDVPHRIVDSLVAARVRAGEQPSEPWLAPSPPNNNAFMFLKSRRDREKIIIPTHSFFTHYSCLNIVKTDSLLVGPRLSCYMLFAVSGLVKLQNTHFYQIHRNYQTANCMHISWKVRTSQVSHLTHTKVQ